MCILLLEKDQCQKVFLSDLFFIFTISVDWKDFGFLKPSNIVSGLDYYYKKDVNSGSCKK